MHWSPLLILLLTSCCCLGCDQPVSWKSRGLSERARKAKLVIYGKVLPKSKESRKPRGLYKVQFEVFCILKGRRVPRYITVVGLGYMPGLCTSSTALVNRTYIAFLKPKSHTLKLYKAEEINVQSATTEVKSPKKVRRLLSNLRTIPMLPKDSEQSVLWGCNADLGYHTPSVEWSAIPARKHVTAKPSARRTSRDESQNDVYSAASTRHGLPFPVVWFTICLSYVLSCLVT